MTTPAERHEAVGVMRRHGLSERASCRYLGVSRNVARYALKQEGKDSQLASQLKVLGREYPCFGYRRIALLAKTSPGRVLRLWQEHGLSLPRKRPRRRRTGERMRLPGGDAPNAVWCYDFVHDRLADGRVLKLLCVLDEYTRECLAIEVGRSLRSQDVILTLSRLMRIYGKPVCIRSDNGAEFTALRVMKWLQDEQVGTVFIQPGSPWQNGFVESFNGKLRAECLNREWFLTRREAKVVIERWRQFYNHQRPHSSLGYQTPVEIREKALGTHFVGGIKKH